MTLPQPRRDARAAVWHAVALVALDPAQPWTVANLADAVGLSVRRLQQVFNQDIGVPPLAYVRLLRLDRAHGRLLAANPGEVTIPRVAHDVGFVHLGRFAGYYRDQFGEAPSATLARDPNPPAQLGLLDD